MGSFTQTRTGIFRHTESREVLNYNKENQERNPTWKCLGIQIPLPLSQLFKSPVVKEEIADRGRERIDVLIGGRGRNL